MILKNLRLKITVLALSLLCISASSNMFASEHSHHGEIKAAQVNYQDETEIVPVVDQPISFSVKNFKTNFDVNSDRSVFEVKVAGLYSIDSFLLLNVPNIDDSVDGYITINERQLLTFFKSETRTLSSPIVEFHFNDRLVYLEKGDKVSVVLSEFPPETTIVARGFVMVVMNNSH